MGKKRTLFQSDDGVIEDVQCAPIEAEESIKLVYYGTCRMANHNSSLYFDCMCGGRARVHTMIRTRKTKYIAGLSKVDDIDDDDGDGTD